MIKLQCVCGHTLNLPDRRGGQKIRCKRCEKVMRVPLGSSSSSGVVKAERSESDPELLIAGSRPCPQCGQMYPPTVVVCVTCGINVDSGAMLYVSMEEGPPPPGVRPAAQLDEERPASGGWLGRLVRRLTGRGG